MEPPEVRTYQDELMFRLGNRMVPLNVRVWKPEPSSGTVFCLHGFNGTGADFATLAVFLAQNGLTVVCPDIIGRGDSAYLRETKLYTLQNYCKALSAIVGNYGEPASFFVGKGWGGLILIPWLRMAGVTSGKSIVTDVPLNWDPVEDMIIQQAIRDRGLKFDDRSAAQQHVLATKEFASVSGDLIESYASCRLRQSQGKFVLNYDETVVESIQRYLPHNFDLGLLLRDMKIPTMLLYGGTVSELKRDELENLEKANSKIAWVDQLAGGGPIHFTTLHQILLLLGFIRSAETPGSWRRAEQAL